MHRLVGRISRVLLVLAAALVAWGMAQPVGGSLVMQLTAEPDSLDPQKSATAVVNQVLRYAGDTLITKDLEGRYTPGLALSWTPSEDDLRWTFVLREGVRFHDGSPLDAEAVRASFLRAKDPATQSNVAAALLRPVQDVVVVDERTVEFVLEAPYYLLIENLTQMALTVVNAQAAAAMGADFNRAPVLTGPWKVGAWESGSRIVLERNPDYAWGPDFTQAGPPYLEQLVFQIVPDQATATAAFMAGNLDVLTVAPSDIETLQSSGRYEMVSFLRKGLGLYMAYYVHAAPFDELPVRQAMAYFIQKEPLVSVSLRGFGRVACGPLPPSIVGYWDGICDHAPGYDPEQGYALLQEAGYERLNGLWTRDGQPLSFSIMTSSTYGWVQSAQVVQEMLRAHGVTTTIDVVEHTTLLSNGREGLHQAIFLGYTYTSADILNSYLNSANIRTGYNWSHHDSEQVDAWLAFSRSTSDDAARAETYEQLQRYVIDQALWLPLWVNDNYIAIQPRIQGARLSSEGFLFLNDAYVGD